MNQGDDGSVWSAMAGWRTVGRDAPLRELAQMLAAARNPGAPWCSLVLITGEAGIGKTRVLEVAAAHAGAEGFQCCGPTVAVAEPEPCSPSGHGCRSSGPLADGDAALAARLGHDHPHVAALIAQLARPEPAPTSTLAGLVIEFEERWDHDGQRWYAREMARADVVGGAISDLAIYCTGDWDEALQARYARQVPLLRP